MLLALFPFLVVGQMPMMVCRAMRTRGLPVAIATYYPAPPQYTVDEALDFSDNCALFKMDAHNAPSDSAELERLVDRLDAKLVVLCGAKPAYAQLARLRESRPDIRQMDWIFNTGPHFRELSNRPSCFDAILVENAAIRDSLDTVPGMGRVIQVASGVDLERFRPRGRAIAAQDSSLVVGYVGRLAAEKNPLGFIDLAEQLHTMMPPLRFVIYGEGPQLDVLKARVAASPARDAIHYKGFAPHPTDALADMDVMVLPSILDGRPAALMEANACGVPVIAASLYS